MSVVTKTGDDGKSRWQGKVVEKDSQLLTAIGDLDELSAIVQMVELEEVATDLWAIMGDLAYEVRFKNYDLRIKQFEDEIKKAEEELPKISKFIFFKTEKGRMLNLARTIARRAERSAVALAKKEVIDKNVLIYLNRLSDYLFILSRIKK